MISINAPRHGFIQCTFYSLSLSRLFLFSSLSFSPALCVRFLSACSECLFPLGFVFCRFIIPNFMVSNANDNRTEERINSHEQYAFERLWLLPLKSFRRDPFISGRPCAHDARPIGRCVRLYSRTEINGKHRGDMTKKNGTFGFRHVWCRCVCVCVFVSFFFKITNVFFWSNWLELT